MDEDTRHTDGEAQRSDAMSMPTARQVLGRGVWSGAVLAAGLPLVVWWLLFGAGFAVPSWLWAFLPSGVFLLAIFIQHIAQAPRPGFPKQVDPVVADRAFRVGSQTGYLNEDPIVRTAAGLFACDRLETAVYVGGAAVGALIILIGRPNLLWVIVAVLAVAFAGVGFARGRHGWRYLKALHAEACPK